MEDLKVFQCCTTFCNKNKIERKKDDIYLIRFICFGWKKLFFFLSKIEFSTVISNYLVGQSLSTHVTPDIYNNVIVEQQYQLMKAINSSFNNTYCLCLFYHL